MRLRVVAGCALCLWFSVLLVSFFFMIDETSSLPIGKSVTTCADVSSNCLTLIDYCNSPDAEERALLRRACPVTCDACDKPPPDEDDAFDCIDRRPECPQLAAADHCDERPLRFWRDCPVSCRVCIPSRKPQTKTLGVATSEGSDCVDHFANCATRAAEGGCHDPTSQAVMVVECAKSCGTCQQRQRQHEAPRDAGVAEAMMPLADDQKQPSAVAPCSDRRRACEYWRGIGECQRPGAQDAMRSLCPASCGFCQQSEAERRPPTVERIVCAPSSRDKHVNCEDWAASGECRRNSEAMGRACACSCRQHQILAKAAVANAMHERAAVQPPIVAAAVDCQDTHERCAGWALIGLCATSQLPMRRLCPRACGHCGSGVENRGRRRRAPRAALRAVAAPCARRR